MKLRLCRKTDSDSAGRLDRKRVAVAGSDDRHRFSVRQRLPVGLLELFGCQLFARFVGHVSHVLALGVTKTARQPSCGRVILR